MKPKSEILKMSKEGLYSYKWDDNLGIPEKKYTNFKCSYCYNCSDCLYCRNLKNKRDGYYICNVEVTKEEFEAKERELGIE